MYWIADTTLLVWRKAAPNTSALLSGAAGGAPCSVRKPVLGIASTSMAAIRHLYGCGIPLFWN
jgi:hypothetical protein